MEFSRTSYKILALLGSEGALDKKHSLTYKEIKEKLEAKGRGLSLVTVKQIISTFNKIGFVDEGLKGGDRNTAKTFFITAKGSKALKEL